MAKNAGCGKGWSPVRVTWAGRRMTLCIKFSRGKATKERLGAAVAAIPRMVIMRETRRP